MENKSFLNKFIFLLIIIVLIIVTSFFILNKKNVSSNMKDVELITSMNVDTFDEDLYIYKIDNNVLYTAPYFYNTLYLSNNTVEFEKYTVTDNTKYYLKTLSNTEKDINDIKVSYDLINKDEFNYLLENYTLLKIYIWKNSDNTVENVLLYSSNNIPLEIEHY